MELTCPQLKSCTFGTKRIWEEARHFCFNRCTNAQREAFYQVNEEWATVARPLLAFLWRLYHPGLGRRTKQPVLCLAAHPIF